ncbi:hypothetical protein AAFF_G00166390 [Aldrovandia affinis]|uniref:Uncharacterized protein n=1 Tax=Aldrovandia affinis TaxID=143900 RepID=A0AAD7RMD5_9TELE|nr:hypothetical protein AAFF_G00166390 [Aldrovandia affinis]
MSHNTLPGDILNSTPLDAAGLGEMAVTSGHTNTRDSFLGVGLDAGSTDLVDLQGARIQTEAPVTGDTLKTMSQTDAVGTVTADPQGIHEGLNISIEAGTRDGTAVGMSWEYPGQSDITPQAQPAASAAEQYITSGQGPQGAENVELEDSC